MSATPPADTLASFTTAYAAMNAGRQPTAEEVWEAAQAALHGQADAKPYPLRFPTMLRKMWSGGEVQAWLDALPSLYTHPGADGTPVDMVLDCPKCGYQHIDAPDEPGTAMAGFPTWTNPPHRSHKCHVCGHTWRPADVATYGVSAVKTKGKNDSPIVRRDRLAVPAARLGLAGSASGAAQWMRDQVLTLLEASAKDWDEKALSEEDEVVRDRMLARANENRGRAEQVRAILAMASFPIVMESGADEPPRFWWIDHGTYGHVTMRAEEATHAASFGAKVHLYSSAAQAAAQSEQEETDAFRWNMRRYEVGYLAGRTDGLKEAAELCDRPEAIDASDCGALIRHALSQPTPAHAASQPPADGT